MTAQIPDWQQQAQAHFSQGNYSEATNLYEEAIATTPSVRDYYWQLGLLYLLQGQEEAQMTLLSAIADSKGEQVEEWTKELYNNKARVRVLEQFYRYKAGMV